MRAKTLSTHRTIDLVLPPDSETQWHAVQARDKSFDGQFWFGVRTTGVFCRPGCAARAPKRANVEFFASIEAAEAAGYRACKRCRPLSASAGGERSALIAEACRLIEEAHEPPRLAELAKRVGLSPFHLQRTFKKALGVSPRGYFESLRRRRLQHQLSRGESVTGALYEAGFGSSSRLYEAGDALLGMRPSRYRRGAAGEVVRFTITACPLGFLLVAATERGLCRIELGREEALAARVVELFPAATRVENDPLLVEAVSSLLAFLADPGASLDLPLDIRGTAFEQRVWSALRAIPPGHTASYRGVAEAIGKPRAARAVARACAANPLALVVPCHRVVASDGSLAGYRWGVERKRRLLAHERGQG